MKTWIKTNFYKITSILALFLATTGLIIGSISYHKTNNLQYYLDYNKQAIWGSSIIWETNVGGEHKIGLYFDTIKHHSDDIKWDGIYPNGYFNK